MPLAAFLSLKVAVPPVKLTASVPITPVKERVSTASGKLTVPVLFLHGEYEFVCETITSRLADPMRQDCANLTEVRVPSGHWMAQERPQAVNAALARWLAAQLPELWIV